MSSVHEATMAAAAVPKPAINKKGSSLIVLIRMRQAEPWSEDTMCKLHTAGASWLSPLEQGVRSQHSGQSVAFFSDDLEAPRMVAALLEFRTNVVAYNVKTWSWKWMTQKAGMTTADPKAWKATNLNAGDAMLRAMAGQLTSGELKAFKDQDATTLQRLALPPPAMQAVPPPTPAVAAPQSTDCTDGEADQRPTQGGYTFPVDISRLPFRPCKLGNIGPEWVEQHISLQWLGQRPTSKLYRDLDVTTGTAHETTAQQMGELIIQGFSGHVERLAPVCRALIISTSASAGYVKAENLTSRHQHVTGVFNVGGKGLDVPKDYYPNDRRDTFGNYKFWEFWAPYVGPPGVIGEAQHVHTLLTAVCCACLPLR